VTGEIVQVPRAIDGFGLLDCWKVDLGRGEKKRKGPTPIAVNAHEPVADLICCAGRPISINSGKFRHNPIGGGLGKVVNRQWPFRGTPFRGLWSWGGSQVRKKGFEFRGRNNRRPEKGVLEW